MKKILTAFVTLMMLAVLACGAAAEDVTGEVAFQQAGGEAEVEVLFRGVVFGGLRRKSRLAAYLIAFLVFGFYSLLVNSLYLLPEHRFNRLFVFG